MAILHPVAATAVALSLALSVGAATAQSTAQTPDKATKPAKKVAAKPAAKPAVYTPPPASPEQVEAAGRVYYGEYKCELNQNVNIVANAQYPSYVDVQHLKTSYLMKPVVSSTGAVRLEDVKGETLMVQIANKSMLLNVKTGHRVVDDCESPSQQEWNANRAAQSANAASPGSSMFAAPTK